MPHLLPDIGEPHPCPYFLTPDVDLRPQKWSTTRMKDDDILKASTFRSFDPNFATNTFYILDFDRWQ